jgi:hypothetical protein
VAHFSVKIPAQFWVEINKQPFGGEAWKHRWTED